MTRRQLLIEIDASEHGCYHNNARCGFNVSFVDNNLVGFRCTLFKVNKLALDDDGRPQRTGACRYADTADATCPECEGLGRPADGKRRHDVRGALRRLTRRC